jgi:prevent-host-death family protein
VFLANQTGPDYSDNICLKGAVRMQITNISEAKATLSKLVEGVLKGDEVIISKAGKPVAKLVPYDLVSSPV